MNNYYGNQYGNNYGYNNYNNYNNYNGYNNYQNQNYYQQGYQPRQQTNPYNPYTQPNFGQTDFNQHTGIINAFKSFWTNYANFFGTSRPNEYWWMVLINIIISIILVFISPILLFLYSLAIIVPDLALIVRRLQDAGYSWPHIFFAFIPVVGSFILLYFLCQPSQATQGGELY